MKSTDRMRQLIKDSHSTTQEVEKPSVTTSANSERMRRLVYGDRVGFDTLDADLKSTSQLLTDTYNNWQTPQQLSDTRKTVEDMNRRLNAYNRYAGIDRSDISDSYKNILANWGDIEATHGAYKTADAFNRSRVFTTLGNDLSNKGLTYDQVKKKRDSYAKGTAEYDFFNEYTGYDDLREYDKALAEMSDGTSKNRVSEARNKYAMEHKADLYRDVMNNSDYAEKSQYNPSESNEVYRYINSEEEKGNIIHKYTMGNLGNYTDPYEQYRYEEMTDEEKGIYNYIYASQGKDKADEFLKDTQISRDKRESDRLDDVVSEVADSGMFGEVYASLLSVPTNLAGGYLSYTNAVGQMITGDVNPYAYGNQYSNMASKAREEVGSNIAERYPDAELFGQNVPQFLYQTGMSIADSTAGAYTMGRGYTPIMGVTAYQQKLKELKEKGIDDNTAKNAALASGIAEAAFEYISLDKLLKAKDIDGIRMLLKETAKQAGIEGSEEVATEISNLITDDLFLGEQSELREYAQSLRDRGYEEKDVNKAIWDKIGSQVGWAGIGGAISGGVMGGVHGGAEYHDTKQTGNAIRGNNRVEDMLDYAYDMPQGSDVFRQYAEYALSGVDESNITDAQLGNLYNKAERSAVSDMNSSEEGRFGMGARAINKLDQIRYTNESTPSDTDHIEIDNGHAVAVTPRGNFTLEDTELSQNDRDILAAVENDPENADLYNAVAKYYDGTQDLKHLAYSYQVTLDNGRKAKGEQYALLKKGILTDQQALEAYREGLKIRNEDGYRKLENITNEHSQKNFRMGVLDDSIISMNGNEEGKISWKSLTPRQRDAIRFLKLFASVSGRDIELISSKIVDGKRVGENGSYNPSTNALRIDVYAGINNATSLSDTIIPTLSHELTHWMETTSPDMYSRLRGVVLDTLGNASISIDAQIAREMDRMRKNGYAEESITEEAAMSEIVARGCEDMLRSSKTVRDMLNQFTEDKRKSIVGKVKKILKNFFSWCNELLSYYDSNSAEAKFLRMYKDKLTEVSNIWDEALKEAVKMNQEYDKVVRSINPTNVMNSDRYENDGLHEKDIRKNYSEEADKSLDEIIKEMNVTTEMWRNISKALNSKFLNDWNNKDGKDRSFTIFKAQSGYKFNVELSSMCAKGIPLFEAIDTIVKENVMKELKVDKLGKVEKEILYEILKKHKFDIPCAICYVEQARQREGVIIDAFVNGDQEKGKLGWNSVLDEVQKIMKKNGSTYEFKYVDRSIATDAYNAETNLMSEEDQNYFYDALMQVANKAIQQYNDNPDNKKKHKKKDFLKDTSPSSVAEVFKGNISANLKIFKTLFQNPDSRFKIEADLLYSSIATRNIADFHKDLYTLFNMQGGVSGYKTKQSAVVYWGDILNKKYNPNKVREEGGIRNQSNSDYMMYLFMDYAQMYTDFTAKGYYLQAYTKSAAELMLFGKSNAKLNASAIPAVIVRYDSNGNIDYRATMLNAGLDENGELVFDSIEGIDINKAMMLASDPEYSKSVCIVCIGYSDNHISKLLDDDRIQMIIGFHDKTNDPDKRYSGARYAFNYNGYNEATYVNKDGERKTAHIGFNKYLKQAEGKFKKDDTTGEFYGTYNFKGKTYQANDIPKLAADLYKNYCEKKGYDPAYSKCSIDFSKHENYYKLLADYGLYDSEGNYAPHKKVTYNLPKEVPYLDGKNVSSMATEDFIQKELEREMYVRDSISEKLADKTEEGIIPEFIKEVNKRNSDRDTSDDLFDDDIIDDEIIDDEVFDDDWLSSLSIDDIMVLLEEDVKPSKKERSPRRIDQVNKRLKEIGLSFNGTTTASWTDERIDKHLHSFASTNKNYAQAYVAYMKPIDFLKLTMGGNTYTVDRITSETENYGKLDMEKLGNEVPMFLDIDEKGKSVVVTGHEGRHRMMLLGKAGFEKVPVLLFNYRNKYDKQTQTNVKLKAQRFNDEDLISRSRDVVIDEMIPFSTGNEQLIKQKFGSGAEAEVRYSDREINNYNLVINTEGNNVRYSDRIHDEDEYIVGNKNYGNLNKYLTDKLVNGEEGKDFVTVYRSFQVINGKLYAPMNATEIDDEQGGKKKKKKLGYNSVIGVFEKATESPDIAQKYMDEHPGAKHAKFNLDGVDNKTDGVAYNPYLHASNLVMNDQFSAAYRRKLITVECRVPVSEMGAYKAKYAKDATGWVNWKPGGTSLELAKAKPQYTRKLFVSRYMLPYRIMEYSEVAKMYKEYISGTDIKIPWNVVGADLRKALVNEGIPIDYSDVKAGSTIKTYEEHKNDSILPLSSIEGYKDPGVSFSDRDSEGNKLTKSQQDYFKDSKIRDTDSNLLVMYHGTQSDEFSVFDSDLSEDGISFFFADNLNVARRYANNSEKQYYHETKMSIDEMNELIRSTGYNNKVEKNGSKYIINKYRYGEVVGSEFEGTFDEVHDYVMEMYGDNDNGGYFKTYLNIKNPLIIDAKNAWWEFVPFDFGDGRTEGNTRDIAEYAKANGYDGVLIKNVIDDDEGKDIFNEAIAFNSSQIKLTENENPTENLDIRFSDRDETYADILNQRNHLETQNNNLIEEIKVLKERLALEKKVTNGKVLNNQDILKIARYVKRNAQSTYDAALIGRDLKEAYNYMVTTNDLDANSLFGRFYDIAKKIAGNKKAIIDPYIENVAKDIRSTKIKVDENQLSYLNEMYGKNYRSALRGLISFDENGTSLDTMWQEWSNQYPDLFDYEVTGEDQISKLIDITESLREGRELVQDFADEEETKQIAFDLYNGYWKVHPIVTTADKYEEKIKKINEEHKKNIDNLKKRIDSQKLADDIHYGKVIHNLVEQRNEARKSGKKMLDNYKERQAKNDLIKKITNTAMDLNKKFKQNSRDNHIPEIMRVPVARLLEAIDFSSRQMLDTGRMTNKDMKLSSALADVYIMINEMQSNGTLEDGIALPPEYDKDVLLLTKAVQEMEKSSGYVLNDMSLEQLEELHNMIKIFAAGVRNLNKFYKARRFSSISSAANESVKFLESLGKFKERNKLLNSLKTTVEWRGLNPVYGFDKFGTVGKEMFKELQDGWSQFAYNVKEILDYSQSVFNSEQVDAWESEVHEFDILLPTTEAEKQSPDYEPKYQKAYLTTAQIMSAYCLSKRDQARGHFFGGGMEITQINPKKGKPINQTERIQITNTELNDIISRLTPEQISIADKLQDFMNGKCSDWGNYVTMELYGFKGFTEKNYFPIKSSQNSISAENPSDKENSLFRLLNMSFTKALTKNANNPITIDSIFNVYAQHTSDMAKYNALALPVLDVYKWFNYKKRTKVGDDSFEETDNVRVAMDSAYGSDAQHFVRTFLQDLNGVSNVGRDVLGKGFYSRFKAASVGANLRVAALQPTSFYRASDVIDPKYLAAGLLHKPNIDMAKKYCGIAYWKSLGFYDVNIQRGLTDLIKDNQTWMQRATEKSMYLASLGDEMTWGFLWNSCLAEMKEKTNLSGEDLYKATADRLTDVIYRTQVVDSTMTRNEMMRSPDGWDKVKTAFMAEPMLSMSMLTGAINDYAIAKRQGIKGDKVRVARAFGAYVVTNTAAAVVEALFNALREEKKEVDEEYIMQAFLENFAQDMSLIGKIPYLKDIESIFRGYSSSNGELQWADSFVKAYQEAVKMAEGKGSLYKLNKNLVKGFSYLSGVPIFNATRDLQGILNRLGILSPEELQEWFDSLF